MGKRQLSRTLTSERGQTSLPMPPALQQPAEGGVLHAGANGSADQRRFDPVETVLDIAVVAEPGDQLDPLGAGHVDAHRTQ